MEGVSGVADALITTQGMGGDVTLTRVILRRGGSRWGEKGDEGVDGGTENEGLNGGKEMRQEMKEEKMRY